MKYMGSKARLVKDISPLINNIIAKNSISLYIEPFVGGANMIEYIQCDNKIGADSNEYLIDMWIQLQKGWIPPESITKERYDDIKKSKNKYDSHIVAIAGFCATYNAKWFGGYAGIVKTKANTYRNYYDESIRNINKQIRNLMDVSFIHTDYTYFSDHRDSLIYCDPPYQGTTQYGICKQFNHHEFWEWVRLVSLNNIVLISEYNAPDDFIEIYSKNLTTTLDRNSRKVDTEKLFISKDTYELISKI